MKRLFLLLALMLLLPLGAEKVVRVITSANFPPYEFHQDGKSLVSILILSGRCCGATV